MYHDNKFIQWIERDSESVNQLFERIKIDIRHFDIREVVNGELELREFSNWDMAFVTEKECYSLNLFGKADFYEASETALIRCSGSYPI